MVVDLTLLQSGDTIHLRNGEIHTVTNVNPGTFMGESLFYVSTVDQRQGPGLLPDRNSSLRCSTFNHYRDGRWSCTMYKVPSDQGDIVKIIHNNTPYIHPDPPIDLMNTAGRNTILLRNGETHVIDGITITEKLVSISTKRERAGVSSFDRSKTWVHERNGKYFDQRKNYFDGDIVKIFNSTPNHYTQG